MAALDYRQTLKEVFGFETFRPGQETIIQQVLGGNSALAVFPTGSGKSLCYQLPALLLPGLTIVISPLIALMKDQADFLLKRSVKVARLDSSLTAEETKKVYADLKAGELKLLYVAPERISNERFFASISGHRISLMVVDEAHCISEWGHNFRPEYLKLAIAARKLKVERVLALTATATPSVVQDIRREFEIPPEAYVNTGFHRPNLRLSFTPTSPQERLGVLRERLAGADRGPTIVYVTLQKAAEEVAEALNRAGLPAKAYHAGMKSEERGAIQDWFMASADGIVVATIAFGMGIDKADIRQVYHFNLPKTLENYSQEIGRAGRDGQPSQCEALGSSEDLVVLENFVYGDTPSREAVERLVVFILAQEELFDISLYHLSHDTDIRPLVLSTLLTYLELEGVLKFTAPFYSEYKFKHLASAEETLAAFDRTRRDFLERLFAQANAKTSWSYLNPDTAARNLGEPRERIVKALTYLEETGRMEVGVTGLRQGMRLLRRPPPEELTRLLVERAERNESLNLQRTRKVVDLLNVAECKTRYLLRYFGEELDGPCGHCDYCETGRVRPVEGAERPLRPEEQEAVRRLQAERPVDLTVPRAGARFLCGIASPQLSRGRSTEHPLFGALEATPFRAVLQALEKAGP